MLSLGRLAFVGKAKGWLEFREALNSDDRVKILCKEWIQRRVELEKFFSELDEWFEVNSFMRSTLISVVPEVKEFEVGMENDKSVQARLKSQLKALEDFQNRVESLKEQLEKRRASLAIDPKEIRVLERSLAGLEKVMLELSSFKLKLREFESRLSS